ncbi:MAG: GNAT family N-acetyltransferase [Anaerolineales bacterium]|nr:GNAT family N-acetyltransferase [Anaerolineales bacterium]
MIYGERIRLRGVEKGDLPRFVEWVNDPDVIAGLTIFLPIAMWEEEEWFANLSKRPAVERPLAVDMRDGDTWRLIGNSGFHDFDAIAHSAEVGIMLGDKSIWHQGYGTEVMRLLLKHGFETLNLNRIQLHVYADNRWAIRTYEKIGFVHEGRKRQALFKNGQYRDSLLMSVLRSEWNEE